MAQPNTQMSLSCLVLEKLSLNTIRGRTYFKEIENTEHTYVPCCSESDVLQAQVTRKACLSFQQSSSEFRKEVLRTRQGQALPFPRSDRREDGEEPLIIDIEGS